MTSEYVSPMSYFDTITPSALKMLTALNLQELKGQQPSCPIAFITTAVLKGEPESLGVD